MYRVTWTIDIEADSPHDAAMRALEIQRDPESIATVFRVRELGKVKERTIDPLLPERARSRQENPPIVPGGEP